MPPDTSKLFSVELEVYTLAWQEQGLGRPSWARGEIKDRGERGKTKLKAKTTAPEHKRRDLKEHTRHKESYYRYSQPSCLA